MTRERSNTGAANTVPINRIKIGKYRFRAHEQAANEHQRRDHCDAGDDLDRSVRVPRGRPMRTRQRKCRPRMKIQARRRSSRAS